MNKELELTEEQKFIEICLCCAAVQTLNITNLSTFLSAYIEYRDKKKELPEIIKKFHEEIN